MNATDGLLPSLDDLLLPSAPDLHQSLIDYSNHQEDFRLFGPPSLILFEGPPQTGDLWRDGDAVLQFPEAEREASSGEQASPTAPEHSAAPDHSTAAPRQRSSGSSGKAAGKVERKAEQNRRDEVYDTMTRQVQLHEIMSLLLAPAPDAA